jgi:hypothetical protein
VSEAREDRPWLDELGEKHECGPSYSEYRAIEVEHEGAILHVSAPDHLEHPERFKARMVLASERHLTLIGSYETEHTYFPGEPRVFLMVAGREDAGPYVVHVWHELYPWALEHLGLKPGGESPSPS